MRCVIAAIPPFHFSTSPTHRFLSLAQATTKAKADVTNCLKVLDEHLLLNTFLVGNHVTLADIVVSCALLPLYTMVRRATNLGGRSALLSFGP